MINNFKNIGTLLLEQDGFYLNDDELEKRTVLLGHQTLKPYVKNDRAGHPVLDGRAICLNFDLDKGLFNFQLSKMELVEGNKKKFFAFRLGAPKDKKKFLVANNLDTLYSALFAQSIDYIKAKQNNNKSKNWFLKNISGDYEKLMQQILDTFYIQENSNFSLDYTKLVPSQRQVFEKIKDGQKKTAKTNDLFNRFLNKEYFNTDSKNTAGFPNICMVLINDEHILSFDKDRFKKDYINLCYYDLLERFFIEDTKPKKRCHICGCEDDVIQNIPFSMKFYGTTNNLNFENAKNANAYKAFAICKYCFQKTLTGMKHIEQYFNEYLFDMNCYMIPHASGSKSLAVFKNLNKLFKKQNKSYKDTIQNIKTALVKANLRTVRFDLFFYFSPAGSQQFDVLQMISNIDMRTLLKKLERFDQASESYCLGKIQTFDCGLTINDLRFFLFPSSMTQSKPPDPKIYRKDLLHFLSGFLNDQPLNYNDLIARFIGIYKKRLVRDNEDRLSPFKMVLFLSIMLKLKKIKGGSSVENKQFVSEILKNEYKHFLEAHPEVYDHNSYRQGLFLLGTIISKIKFAQQKKGKNANFLKKLNFNGFPARRLLPLIGQVKEYAEIYQIYEEPGIWGSMMDRLQGIETSRIKPDEILFYILSGISFEDYLGMKYKYDKKLAENDNQ